MGTSMRTCQDHSYYSQQQNCEGKILQVTTCSLELKKSVTSLGKHPDIAWFLVTWLKSHKLLQDREEKSIAFFLSLSQILYSTASSLSPSSELVQWKRRGKTPDLQIPCESCLTMSCPIRFQKKEMYHFFYLWGLGSRTKKHPITSYYNSANKLAFCLCLQSVVCKHKKKYFQTRSIR